MNTILFNFQIVLSGKETSFLDTFFPIQLPTALSIVGASWDMQTTKIAVLVNNFNDLIC